MKRVDWNDGWEFRKIKDEQGGIPHAAQARWLSVTLPHDAMIHERRNPATANSYNSGYYPGGAYEYRRRFTVTGDEPRGQWLLEFEGVYPQAVVSVNGRMLARHSYGYGNFFVDLRPALHSGDNEMLVAVDNTAVPNSRWYSGAGIFRPVWLWRSEGELAIRPDAVRVATLNVGADGTAEIGIDIERPLGGPLDGDGNRRHDVCAEVFRNEDYRAQRSCMAIASGEASRLVARVPHADLWSVDHPALYVCRLTVRDHATGDVVDEHLERFGIRTLACDARRGLTVNGQRVLLNGGCVHHDNGILGAATLPQAEFRRARILKAAGFNAVRSAHNPLSKAFLNACDEVGLLVMDEAFDMWWMHKTPYDFASWFRDCWPAELDAMARKDRNHPSVVLYSIGNEIADTKSPRAATMAGMMVDRIHGIDPTRPVIDCVNTISLLVAAGTKAGVDEPDPSVEGKPGLNTTLERASGPALLTLIDRLMPLAVRSGVMDRQTRDVFERVDIAGLNYCKEGPEYWHRRYPERVFCASETYPQDIARNWPAIQRNPYLIGDFVWTGWDYIGEASVSAWAYEGARNVDGWYAGHGDRLGFVRGRTAPYRRYPALLGASGLIDITGYATSQAYYRAVVTGNRHSPYITVRPMTLLRGVKRTMRFIERGHDGVRSWSWHGFEDQLAFVQVFSGGKSVRLELNGETIGVAPVRRCCADFAVPYEPGTLVAVSLDARGCEIARDAIRSANPDELMITVLQSAVGGAECDPIRRSQAGRNAETSLVYCDIELTDRKGLLHASADREITVSLNQAAIDAGAELLGVASANPITRDELASPGCTTYFGRAQAIIRVPNALPRHAKPAELTVSAAGLSSQCCRLSA